MSTYNLEIKSFLAGVSIALGGLVYLSVSNPIVGSLLFSIGLLLVCVFDFNLFTGKICYALDRLFSISDFVIIWFFNIVGTFFVGILVSLTRHSSVLREKALVICSSKFGDSFLSLFVLGILCNFFIFIAVEGYKKIEYSLGKFLVIVLGVSGFILSGTEHCIADAFYFAVSGTFDLESLTRVIVITIGNSFGGILFYELYKSSKFIR